MFGARFFGPGYFGGRYFGEVGADPSPGSAADVWDYVLSNGQTAGATLVQVHAWLRDLYRIHGLEVGSPLSVAATQRSAGPVIQDITEVAGVVTVERQP